MARGGTGALHSMHALAGELGAGTMSLYHHVANSDDLIAGILDHVAGNLTFPAATADPLEELTGIFEAIYTGFMRDEWLIHLLFAQHEGSARIISMVERASVALHNLGHQGLEI